MTTRILTSIVLVLLTCESFCQDIADEKRHRGKAAQWREKQEQVFAVNFSIAGEPSFAAESFYNGRAYYYDYSYQNNTFIENMYKDYRGKVKTAGVIGGGFNWNFSRWFNISGYLGLCPFWTKTYDAKTSSQKASKFGMAVTVMPKLKIVYCNRPVVRVYTDLALGLALYPGFSELQNKADVAAQVNFVGVEVGRKWYGLAEIGCGTVFTGISAGFGHKF